MAATVQQLIEWLEIIERDGVNLTTWEATFVADMMTKVEQYGERTKFSDSQAEQVERIYSERVP